MYGSQGVDIAGVGNTLPSYAVASTTGILYSYAASTTDVRAPLDLSGSGRTAEDWYSPSNSFDFNLDLSNGSSHQVALYLLDFDKQNRQESVQVLDAGTDAVLATQTVYPFINGAYALFNVSGNVIFRMSRLSGGGPVLTGVFLDPVSGATPIPTPTPTPAPTPTPSATFLSLNTSTQGNWRGVYGSQGVDISGVGDTLLSYATASTTGIPYTWAASTTDVRAPQNLNGTGRTAAEWYAGSTFDFDLGLTDGATHQVALYLVDFDGQNRQETIQVLSASTKTLLSAETVYPFSGGDYALFNVSGGVIFRITKLSGGSPSLTGIFVDPVYGPSSSTSRAPSQTSSSPSPVPMSTSASYISQDTGTQGNWRGLYGSQGVDIAGVGDTLPAYAVTTTTGAEYTWAASTTDVGAPLDLTGSDRTAAEWYGASSFDFNLNLTDGKTHRVALYLVDYDNQNRQESIQVLNASDDGLLATETIYPFSGGDYVLFNVNGSVTFRLSALSGGSSTLSGVFVG